MKEKMSGGDFCKIQSAGLNAIALLLITISSSPGERYDEGLISTGLAFKATCQAATLEGILSTKKMCLIELD
jgi:hypothetical protein